MKQLPRLLPLIRPKLPRLPRCHNTHHPLPRLLPPSKLTQRLHTIHHKVPTLHLRLPSAAIDVSALAVDGDHVFRARVAFGGGAGTGGGGGLEGGILEEELDVVHGNEGGGGGGDDDDGVLGAGFAGLEGGICGKFGLEQNEERKGRKNL